MPYYSMHCQKAECQHSEDMLMKYDEMQAGVSCSKCGGDTRNRIGTPMIKDFGTGGKAVSKAKVPIGPLHPKSKAYEKKHDERVSTFYRPDQTFGNGGVKEFKQLKKRQLDAYNGKTDFTKDK